MDLKKIKKNHIDINKGINSPVRRASENFGDFAGRTGKNRSVLFSKGGATEFFYTEDSKLYITPRERMLMEKGVELDRAVGKWDSLSSRIVRDYVRYAPSRVGLLHRQLKRSYEALQDDVTETSRTILGQFSMVRLWNLSIVGAILLGMFSMTMFYRYLGQGAVAGDIRDVVPVVNEISVGDIPKVAGTADVKISDEDADSYTQHLIADIETDEKDELEKEIMEMVKGHPIEEMVPYIAEKDRIVAAFLVGIARKESNWGKRVPVLEGQDCYNYWGYRGIRKLMGTGGHTCFNSRKDAVDTVAKRIQTLVEKEELDTPEKMVIWKCGSNCAVTGGQAAANKWISDVNTYFKKLN